jgi:membrane-associated phospholipid phosphatase
MRRLGSVVRRTAERPASSRFAREHPGTYLGLHGLVGLALAAACAWAFFQIAEDVPENGRMVAMDTAAAAWLQMHGTERGETIFANIAWLGAGGLAVSAAIALLFLARRSGARMAFVAVAYAGAVVLNQLLKAIFQRARPSFAAEFLHHESFSFPSGHAMESFVVYGAIAYLIIERFPPSRSVVAIAWVLLVAIIGFSRLYLGVHYASDVAAGFAAGFVWLFTCVTGYRFAERRRISATS